MTLFPLFRVFGSRRLMTAGACVVALSACGGTSETSSPTTVSSEAPATACQTTDLNASVVSASTLSPTTRSLLVGLENKTSAVCSLSGYPTVRIFNGDVVVVEGARPEPLAEANVSVSPRSLGYFEVLTTASPGDTAGICAPATRLAITPPANNEQLLLPLTNIGIPSLCAPAGVTVTPVRADPQR